MENEGCRMFEGLFQFREDTRNRRTGILELMHGSSAMRLAYSPWWILPDIRL